VKKVILIVALAGLTPVGFLGALVGFVNARGGLGPEHAHLAQVPLVGSLFRVQAPAEPASAPDPQEAAALDGVLNPSGGAVKPAAGPAAPAAGVGSLIVSLGGAEDARALAALVEQLEKKRDESDTLLLRLRRKSRELAVWERQLKSEREALQKRFAAERADLEKVRAQVAAEQQRLRKLRIALGREESANLKKTAEIYGKMEPERAARILAEMYLKGGQDEVVKIVHLMQDRAAANLLAALPDEAVSAEITRKLAHVGRPVEEGGE